jgi:hypothetical protein
MNRRPSANPLWQEHLERLQRLHSRIPATRRRVRRRSPLTSEDRGKEARRAEWTAKPPGRVGRKLLAEIEPYLEFFAIARGRWLG